MSFLRSRAKVHSEDFFILVSAGDMLASLFKSDYRSKSVGLEVKPQLMTQPKQPIAWTGRGPVTI